MKIRIIPVIAAAVLLTACGKSDGSSSDAVVTTASQTSVQTTVTEETVSETASSEAAESEAQGSSLVTLRDALMSADSNLLTGSAIYGEEIFTRNTKKLYQCKPDELADGLIVFNDGGGKADEISVVKRTDGASMIDILESRKDLRYNDFKGYVPEELPKIEAGRTFTVGDWNVLIISDSAEKLESIVKEKLS